MTARIYFNTATGSNAANYVEVDARMRLLDWEVREQAEEGSAAMSTIVFDDPDMDWDVTPWRGWYMVEDASTGSNSIICGGWIADQEIGREGGDRENPLARIWSVNLTDANSYWQMRVMVGDDSNRPAETDVERMQWLLATNEVAWAYDTTTYVQTTSPIAMDACDYRGQMLNQIMDDCAQASGRNWFTWIDLVGGVRKVMVWYGHDDWAVYDSPLFLTNDAAEIVPADITSGSSLIWPISPDTKLQRDPSRMYDGCYLTYDGGAVYRDTNPRTVRRDFIAPSLNVKSKTKAIARAERYLTELAEQDDVITTSVELPASRVTQLRAGMRVKFRATHLPNYTGYTWCRVLSCAVAPIDDGTRYRLTLELSPVEPAPTGGGFLAAMEGGWPNDAFWTASFWADGVEILTAPVLQASMGYLIPFPDGPVTATTWELRLTVNWTTVFMPAVNFLYALCITPDGTDLFGNGWTPGGNDINSRTSVSHQTFVATGPADGFSLYGWLDSNPLGSHYGEAAAYGTLTVDQTTDPGDPTNAWGVDQTDIINNTVRTLVYKWTWTV